MTDGEMMTLNVLVNGTRRDKITVPRHATIDEIKDACMTVNVVWLPRQLGRPGAPATPRRVIFVTGKLVNIIT